MAWFLDIDWGAVLTPRTSPLEPLIRGTLTSLALFLALRRVLERQVAAPGVTDLMVVVLIADAAYIGHDGRSSVLPDEPHAHHAGRPNRAVS